MKVRLLISGLVWVVFFALGVLYAARHLHIVLGPAPVDLPVLSLTRLLLRNLWVTVALLVGFVTGGAATLLLLAFNGAVAGISAYELYLLHGALWATKGLVPHGLLEIPAMVTASAVGLAGFTWMRTILNTDPPQLCPRDWKTHVLWAVVACAMMALAGLVETYVTPGLLL